MPIRIRKLPNKNRSGMDLRGVDTPPGRKITITTEPDKPHKPKLRMPTARSVGKVGKEVRWVGRGVYQKGRRRVIR